MIMNIESEQIKILSKNMYVHNGKKESHIDFRSENQT